jgi:hypothetical protein
MVVVHVVVAVVVAAGVVGVVDVGAENGVAVGMVTHAEYADVVIILVLLVVTGLMIILVPVSRLQCGRWCRYGLGCGRWCRRGLGFRREFEFGRWCRCGLGCGRWCRREFECGRWCRRELGCRRRCRRELGCGRLCRLKFNFGNVLVTCVYHIWDETMNQGFIWYGGQVVVLPLRRGPVLLFVAEHFWVHMSHRGLVNTLPLHRGLVPLFAGVINRAGHFWVRMSHRGLVNTSPLRRGLVLLFAGVVNRAGAGWLSIGVSPNPAAVPRGTSLMLTVPAVTSRLTVWSVATLGLVFAAMGAMVAAVAVAGPCHGVVLR